MSTGEQTTTTVKDMQVPTNLQQPYIVIKIVDKLSIGKFSQRKNDYEFQKNDRSLTNPGTNNTLIMVWIHTHVVMFQLECKLTKFAVFQLILV